MIRHGASFLVSPHVWAALLAAGLALEAGSAGFQMEGMREVALERHGVTGRLAVERWQAVLAQWRGLPEDQMLREVNAYFNRNIRYEEDLTTWGVVDYWATPLELLARGAGDCEDFVFAKYFTLRELGFRDENLRMTYVRVQTGSAGREGTQAHMVLSYHSGPGQAPLILDNLLADVRTAGARPDLEPVFSFNTQGVFAQGAVRATSPADRLSRWREMLVRMRSEGYRP